MKEKMFLSYLISSQYVFQFFACLGDLIWHTLHAYSQGRLPMEIAFSILCSASVKILVLSFKKATRKPHKNPNKQANKNHHHQTMPGYLILSLFLGSEGQKQWHIIFIFFSLMTVTWSNSVCAWTVLAVYHGSLPSLGSRLTESRMCYWQSGFSSGGKC